MPRKVPYTFVMDFDSDIASGASGTGQVITDGDGEFVIEEFDFEAWIPNASGGAVARTPLARDPSPTIGSNTFAALNMLFLSLETNGDQKWQNLPVCVSNFIRKSANNWAQTQRVLPKKTQVTGTLTNRSGQTVQGQLIFRGYKILP